MKFKEKNDVFFFVRRDKEVYTIDEDFTISDLVGRLEFKKKCFPFEIQVTEFDDEMFFIQPAVKIDEHKLNIID